MEIIHRNRNNRKGIDFIISLEEIIEKYKENHRSDTLASDCLGIFMSKIEAPTIEAAAKWLDDFQYGDCRADLLRVRGIEKFAEDNKQDIDSLLYDATQESFGEIRYEFENELDPDSWFSLNEHLELIAALAFEAAICNFSFYFKDLLNLD